MVKLIAFYKSTRCTNGFYTEPFENGEAYPAVVKRHCDTCDAKHDFTHDLNHMAGSKTGIELLKAWAEQNYHDFGVTIKDNE